MFYSLYDCDSLGQMKSYANAYLLDPISKWFISKKEFASYYNLTSQKLTKGINSKDLSRMDYVLYRFSLQYNTFQEFGKLISCSSLNALIPYLTSQQESELNTGIAQPKFEDIIKMDLQIIIDNNEQYKEWKGNPFFFQYLRRLNLLPQIKGVDNFNKLAEDYKKKFDFNPDECFELCLEKNILCPLDGMALPEDLNFDTCKNYATLEYALLRTKEDNYNVDLPELFGNVLSLPGKYRFDLLLKHFGDVAQENMDNEDWATSFLKVASKSDYDTVIQYYDFLKGYITLNNDELYIVLIKRGAHFYMKMLSWFDVDNVNDDIYVLYLPYLRDATMLAKELNKLNLNEETLRKMLILCCSLQYNTVSVCGNNRNVTVGMAMFDVIYEKITNKDIGLLKDCFRAALIDGSSNIAAYVSLKDKTLQVSGPSSIKDFENILCKPFDDYYIIDIDKIELGYFTNINKEDKSSLAAKVGANIDDNPETAKRFLKLYPVFTDTLLVSAYNKRNYRTVFTLLAEL